MASQALTAGEVVSAKMRIHNRRYFPFQPKNCTVTPNGRLYFHRSCFLDDFATGPVDARHWFMHEMVKVV